MAIVGNIITLLIVFVVLYFYRKLDKRNRSLDKIHKYAEQLKSELSTFVAEKEGAVKDYSIDLDVQQKSAKELMNKLRVTEEELADKTKAMAKIDERISAYDASLEELVRMTSAVQGNLERIREESSFVESVNKKVSDTREKAAALEKHFTAMQRRFDEENAASLSKMAESILGEVKSSVAALQSEAETVQREVREQREAIEKTERVRAANLAKDMEIINKTLQEVAGRAGAASEKMEEALLAKLKSQSEERVARLQNSIEENLRRHQETARAQIANFESMAAKQWESCSADSAALEDKLRRFEEEWSREAGELSTLLKNQQSEWLAEAERKEADSKQVLSDLERAAANIRTYIVEQNDALENKLEETRSRMDETAAALEERLAAASREADRRTLEQADERLGNWKQLAFEADENLQKTLRGLEVSSQEIKDMFKSEIALLEQRLADTKVQTEGDIEFLKQQIADAALEARSKASEEADANFSRIFHSFEEMDKSIADMQEKTKSSLSQMESRLQETAAAAEKRVLESADVRLDDWKQLSIDTESRLKNLLQELESARGNAEQELQAEMERVRQQIADAREHTNTTVTEFENIITKTAAAVDAKIAREADAQLVHQSEAGSGRA